MYYNQQHTLLACLLQGIAGLAQHVHDHEPASLLLCQLFNHRASARLGLHRPAAALDDALSSIRVKRTFARGYLRAATCYTKMGLLGAAAAVLDKVRREMQFDRCSSVCRKASTAAGLL
jgi:uncharacterized membrane-anchored protein